MVTEKSWNLLKWRMGLLQDWGSWTSSTSSDEILPKSNSYKKDLSWSQQRVKGSKEATSERPALLHTCFSCLSDICK